VSTATTNGAGPALLDLLPDLYAVRDAERGGPLEAVLALLDEELQGLRGDVDGLYDDWFIETCAEWVVPYIGELVGIRGLRSTPGGVSGRALVANTIGYRRRKGTAAVLEDLARDVTGWPARAVEFFSLLGWTQSLNHVRPGAGGTIDLRSASRLELVDSPFDWSAHTADVRHIDNRRGRHNIPNVGIFLWRLGAFALERVGARPIAGHPGCFQLDPLGLERPLFNVGTPEREVAHIAEEINVPGPIRRRALHDEVAGAASTTYLGAVDPTLRVWVDAAGEDDIGVCDLEPPDRGGSGAGVPRLLVDPERGRIRVTDGDADTKLEASWAYGFAGELGGGPYDRTDSLDALFRAEDDDRRVGPVTWQRGVWGPAQALDTDVVTDLDVALGAWDAADFDRREVAVIALMDSRTHEGDLVIKVPGGTTLILVAADWPDLDPDPLAARRELGAIDPSGPRPHIAGNIEVRGTPGSGGSEPGTLVLDGLLVEGTVTVSPGSLGRLRLAHCTVLPDPAGAADPAPLALGVQAGGTASQRNTQLEVELVRSSTGPVAVTPFARALAVEDSIVRGGVAAGAPVDAIAAGDARVERATVIGGTASRTIEASDCLFLAAVEVERRQQGCVRYSYLPEGSRVPRRFRCQPDGPPAHRPSFVSLDPAAPGYAQLHPATPAEIASGASNRNEMGAFNFTRASDRLAHLNARLGEYVRFGLEAGVFLAT
jgi:hypothetical protein